LRFAFPGAVSEASGSRLTSQLLGKFTNGATEPTAAGMTLICPSLVGSVSGVNTEPATVPPVFICWASAGPGASSLMPNRGESVRTFIEVRPAPLPAGS
jgi:hypothetical protein